MLEVSNVTRVSGLADTLEDLLKLRLRLRSTLLLSRRSTLRLKLRKLKDDMEVLSSGSALSPPTGAFIPWT